MANAESKRNQITAIIVALLLFLCGTVAGALGYRLWEGSVVSAKGSPESARKQYLTEMQDQLKLTSNQVEQLQRILDDTKAKSRLVREQYHPELARIKAEQVSRVKAILTPAQIPAYEQLVAERERRYRQAEEREQQSSNPHTSRPQ